MDDLLNLALPTQRFECPPNSNIWTLFVGAKQFMKLIKVEIPEIQRGLDLEHVKSLKISFLNDYKKKGYIDLGIITICLHANHFFIINGQHRYAVLKQFDDDLLKNIYIRIELKPVGSNTEMKELWISSNYSKQAIIIKNTNDQAILNGIEKYFRREFIKYISNSIKPNFPHFNLQKLMECLREKNFIQRCQLQSASQATKLIDSLNQFYKLNQHNINIWKHEWKIKTISIGKLQKCQDKSPSNTLYLSIWREFEWIDRLITHIEDRTDFKDMKHYTIQIKSRKIPKALRRNVWKKRNTTKPESGSVGKCYVCHDDTLEYDQFQCGHVKAYYLNGETNLNNLEPICGVCNQEMGIENLEDFKKRCQKKV